MRPKSLVTFAAVFGATAVAAGAFGAHALADVLTPARLEVWQTASRYQLLHAVALLALAASGGRIGGAWTGRCWAAGVLVFSGSLYALCLLRMPILGAITPIGGGLLIVGWIALGVSAVVDDGPSGLN